jgi:hypothetical protein
LFGCFPLADNMTTLVPADAKLELFFSARNLRDEDWGPNKSDPVVAVYAFDDTMDDDWRLVGTTEIVKNNLNPDFNNTITLEYRFAEAQQIKIVVHDSDGSAFTSSDPQLGSVILPLKDLVREPVSEHPLEGNGVLKITAERIQPSKDVVTFRLKANHVKSMDFVGKSDPFLRIYRDIPASDGKGEPNWVLVHETETVDNTKEPVWKPFTLTASKLCNGDLMRILRFSVYDRDGDDDWELIGSVDASVEDLQNTRSFDVKGGKKGDQVHGRLVAEEVQIQKVFGFSDFVAAGLPITLLTAIDYTGSNGQPTAPDSLHFLGASSPNQYEKALRAVGSVLFPYDSLAPDRQHDSLTSSSEGTNVIGFGGDWGQGVSHCHPLGEAKDTDQLVSLYQESLKDVTLSGPTYLRSVVAHAVQYASTHTGYTVLMVLTDGSMNDFDATCREIRAAVNQPISVVLVGVGSHNFDQMNELDDHVGSDRDLVKFVPFNRYCRNTKELASQVLKEIPKHQGTGLSGAQRNPETSRRLGQAGTPTPRGLYKLFWRGSMSCLKLHKFTVVFFSTAYIQLNHLFLTLLLLRFRGTDPWHTPPRHCS